MQPHISDLERRISISGWKTTAQTKLSVDSRYGIGRLDTSGEQGKGRITTLLLKQCYTGHRCGLGGGRRATYVPKGEQAKGLG